MTKDEALKLSLEAFECALSDDKPYIVQCKEAITAIKEALAQPEQDGKCKYCTDGCHACDARKLPAQRTWVGLTDEEIQTEWVLTPQNDKAEGIWFGRRIEAKLKEKNT